MRLKYKQSKWPGGFITVIRNAGTPGYPGTRIPGTRVLALVANVPQVLLVLQTVVPGYPSMYPGFQVACTGIVPGYPVSRLQICELPGYRDRDGTRGTGTPGIGFPGARVPGYRYLLKNRQTDWVRA
eukprot:2695366-Rhodomonas_salina.1